jgi:hypothetical protein
MIATTTETSVVIHSSVISVPVVNDDGVQQSSYTLPDAPPAWAMSFSDHSESIQRTATYRCLSCGGEHEQYSQNPRALPYAKVCGCVVEPTAETETSLTTCTSPAIRRVTYPGEGIALNARRFEPLVIYERPNHESLGRSQNRYYIPGRNNEPTEPGMKRIDITNIQQYNRVAKEINQYETQKMRDHREMHRVVFQGERELLRARENARVSQSSRYHALRELIRKRSDQKSHARYGKPLDAHFHAQLIEFDQGKIQDWCDADTGWKSRRAK